MAVSKAIIIIFQLLYFPNTISGDKCKVFAPKISAVAEAAIVPDARTLLKPIKTASGQVAYHGNFPYHVFIFGKFSKCEGNLTCNGAIISHTVILSAASCFPYNNTKLYQVYLGTIFRFLGDRYDITHILPHSEYHIGIGSMYQNDIAIVRIKGRIEYGINIQRVPIAWKYLEITDVVFTGYGSWNKTMNISNRLMYLRTRTIPLEECIGRYAPIPIDENFICTEYRRYGNIVGDFGGPLVALNGRLIGLASRMYDEEVYPRCYTRLSAYINWINIHLGKYTEDPDDFNPY